MVFDTKNPQGERFYSQDKNHTKDLLLKAPLAYTPGQSTIYSDTGFMVLGIVIEHLFKKNLSKTAKELMYQPLGLRETTFNPLRNGIELRRIAATSIGNTCNGTMNYPNIRKGLIRGEVQDEKAYYSMDGIAGHAGLFSCSEEILKMCDIIHRAYGKNVNAFFSRDTILEFTKPAGPDDTFGCGWRINTQKKYSRIFSSKASENSIGHTGFTGTLSLIDLENHLSLVLLMNKIHTRCYEREKYSGAVDFATGKYASVVEAVYECMGL